MTSGDDSDRDGIGPDDLQDIGMGPGCPKCGKRMDWLRCWNCSGEGCIESFDVTPDFFDGGDAIPCQECEGKGGWWRCANCGRCFDLLGEGGEIGGAAASSSGGGAGEDATSVWMEKVGKAVEDLAENLAIISEKILDEARKLGEELEKAITPFVESFNLGEGGDGEEDHCACVDRDRAACFRMRYGIEDMRDLAEEGGPCECVCHDRWESIEERWEEELPDRWWEMDDEEDGE